jgi:hypothetical protein
MVGHADDPKAGNNGDDSDDFRDHANDSSVGRNRDGNAKLLLHFDLECQENGGVAKTANGHLGSVLI